MPRVDGRAEEIGVEDEHPRSARALLVRDLTLGDAWHVVRRQLALHAERVAARVLGDRLRPVVRGELARERRLPRRMRSDQADASDLLHSTHPYTASGTN